MLLLIIAKAFPEKVGTSDGLTAVAFPVPIEDTVSSLELDWDVTVLSEAVEDILLDVALSFDAVSSAEPISDDETLSSLSVSLTVDDIEEPSEISGGASDNGEFSIPIKKSIIARAIAIPLLIFALSFKKFLKPTKVSALYSNYILLIQLFL